MNKNEITSVKSIKTEFDEILALDIDTLRKKKYDELLEISNILRSALRLKKNEKKEELEKKLAVIQRLLYDDIKTNGELAFHYVNGVKHCSANLIYDCFGSNKIVRSNEILSLEKYFDVYAVEKVDISYYTLNTSRKIIVTHYFDFKTVLNKIKSCYVKPEGRERNEIESLPKFFNKKFVQNFLGITRYFFEDPKVQKMIGYYNINFSSKVKVLYSLEDIYIFSGFIKFLDNDKENVEYLYQVFLNLKEEERKLYYIDFESFKKLILNF